MGGATLLLLFNVLGGSEAGEVVVEVTPILRTAPARPFAFAAPLRPFTFTAPTRPFTFTAPDDDGD